MTESAALLRSIQPEHRIFWTARAGTELPKRVAILRGFFVRYAKRYQRSFPWRTPATKPFELLVAELLLAQTKAEDVARIWPVLIARYPSPDRLARAHTRTLTCLLQPLGLQNQRARGLKALARALLDGFDGTLPKSIPELLSLPHIGLYAACAVACFGHGQRVPIVDANVLRVFGRLTGIEPGRELRRSPRVWEIAWALLPRTNFVLHNYGLLDFAAEICKATAPRCPACSLRNACVYAQTLRSGEGDERHDGANLACTT